MCPKSVLLDTCGKDGVQIMWHCKKQMVQNQLVRSPRRAVVALPTPLHFISILNLFAFYDNLQIASAHTNLLLNTTSRGDLKYSSLKQVSLA